MHQWSVVVRDAHREVRYELTSEMTMALVAGLSGDPETIDELVACTRRFLGDRWHAEWMSDHLASSRGGASSSDDYGIDVPGRLIVHSARSPEPPRVASVRVHDSVREEPYLTEHHLASEWEIRPWTANWREQAEQRREPRRIRLRDGRRGLYEELAPGLIDAWRQELKTVLDGGTQAIPLNELAKSARCELSERTLNSLISRIHARWLLTPRESLQGKTPRDLLVEHNDHIRFDIGQRTDQWIATGREVEEVPSSSPAYTGPYIGPVELTLYHQLVETLIRRLLQEVNERVQAAHYRQQTVFEFVEGESEPFVTSKPTGEDWKFVATFLRSIKLEAFPDDELIRLQANAKQDEVTTRELIRILNRDQAEFLEHRRDSLCGFSPDQLITLERKRLPISVNREFAPVDCDCPLCVMLEHQASIQLWNPATDWLPTDYVFSRVKSFDAWTPEVDEQAIDASWRGDNREGEHASTQATGNGKESSSSSARVQDEDENSMSEFEKKQAIVRQQMEATAGLEFRCLIRVFESPFVVTVTLQDDEDSLTSSAAFQNLFEVGAILATIISIIKEKKQKLRDTKQAVKRLNEQFRMVRDVIVIHQPDSTMDPLIRQFRHTVNRYAGRFPECHEHMEPLNKALDALQENWSMNRRGESHSPTRASSGVKRK